MTCHVERRVEGVVVLLDGVVVGAVVADDERPASLVARVPVAAVQHVTVEEDGVT